MPRVSIDLKNGLYEQFAIKCVKHRKKKVEVVRELIEEWTKNNA